MWPHDSHTCKLKFGSWTGHGGQIELGLYDDQESVEDNYSFYTDNKEWQLVKTPEASKKNNTYPGFEQYYPDITFTFNLQRSSPSYRAGVILPCLVTMLLVLSTFLLPPSAGDKLLVNTGCFLGERRAPHHVFTNPVFQCVFSTSSTSSQRYPPCQTTYRSLFSSTATQRHSWVSP